MIARVRALNVRPRARFCRFEFSRYIRTRAVVAENACSTLRIIQRDDKRDFNLVTEKNGPTVYIIDEFI